MLGTFRSRRVGALACFVATACIGTGLGAQPRGRARPATPVRIADCDITVESCGTPGGELYGGGDTGSGVSGTTGCGSGAQAVCKTIEVSTCTEWVTTDVSGKISIGPTKVGGGFGIAESCQQYVTNTLTFYIYH